jgi:polar amino acid transport system substrate-binding protein
MHSPGFIGDTCPPHLRHPPADFGLQRIAGLRIGIKNGVEYFPRFDQDRSLQKHSIGNMDNNFKKLVLGRLDAVLIAEDQGEALLARLGLRNQVEQAPYREPDPGPRAIGLAKQSAFAPQLAIFEQAMAAMVKDGTVKQLRV